MDLRLELLELVRQHGSVNCTEMSELTGYTRQAVHRHLRALVEAGELAVAGRARATRYFFPGSLPGVFALDLADVDEDAVWAKVSPALIPDGSTAAAAELSQFAVQELLRNAASHSAAASASLTCRSHPALIRCEMSDSGIGLFARIRERLKLPSELDALFLLSKAPLTTQPASHFGRGLFLLAAACERLELEANGLYWVQDNRRGDQLLSETTKRPGTRVACEIDPGTEVDLASLTRERMASSSPLSGVGRVRLFERGGQFVSRAEARRLLDGMDRFSDVELDFQGVLGVGYRFAEELFGAWAAAHPNVRLRAIHAGPVVARVLLEAGAKPGSIAPSD